MKIDPQISAELARLEPNQIGVLAWSLMAHPPMSAVGIPGQPDPDFPGQTEPQEPGVPTIPDEPPPAPVA